MKAMKLDQEGVLRAIKMEIFNLFSREYVDGRVDSAHITQLYDSIFIELILLCL